MSCNFYAFALVASVKERDLDLKFANESVLCIFGKVDSYSYDYYFSLVDYVDHEQFYCLLALLSAKNG